MTRRTGKAGAGADSGDDDGSVNDAQSRLHSLLDEKSEQAGLVMADRFQAKTLIHMMSAISSGHVGSQTLQLLEAMGAEDYNPLQRWGAELPILQEVRLLNSSESNGLLS